MWFKPTTDELKHDTVKGIPCPTDFCRKCESPICKFDIKNQCASGRDQESFLCSKCEKDKYLAYGSAKCSIKEKGWWKKNWWKIPTLLIVVFVALGLLVFLNIDIYESYLTSVIFFYQVVELFLTTTQRYDGALYFLITLCNLEGFGSERELFHLYFGSSFNAHSKAIPTFTLIVVAILVLILLIYLRAYGCGCCKKYLPKNNYKACVFIIFYFYGAFFQLCIRVVGLIEIKELRLYRAPSTSLVDASVGHKALFGIGVIFIFFAFIFPFLIIFDCNRLTCCRKCNNDMTRHIKDLFRKPFRTDGMPKLLYSMFSGYYMLFGNFLKIINAIAVYHNLGNQLTIMILTIWSVVFLIAFMVTEPYKKTSGLVLSMNKFDTIILFILCVVGVLSNGKQKIPSFNVSDDRLDWAIHGFLWIPIGLCLLLNILRLFAFMMWICCIEEKDEEGKVESPCGKFKKYMAGKYEQGYYYEQFKKEPTSCCSCRGHDEGNENNSNDETRRMRTYSETTELEPFMVTAI